MTQKYIKKLKNEVYSKGPKKNYVTNKTDVYHVDDIWSLDILDLKGYGPEHNRGYRYVLVIIENFSKYGWTVPLKNRNAQIIKDFLENILISSRRKPNLIETDRGKEFFNNISHFFFYNNNIKHFSTNTSLGTVIAERLNPTVKNLLKRPVFEKRDGIWIDFLPTTTKQYINRIHSYTKLTPIQASLKKLRIRSQ